MNNLRLGSVLGVPVAVHWSFLLVALVVLLQALAARAGETEARLTLFLLAVGALVLHEGGHALAARLMGVRVRGIVLHIFGGVTHLDRRSLSVRGEIPTSLGGPAVNLGLGLLYLAPTGLLQDFGLINLLFGVVNLVPAWPLDGGRLLRALLALRMPRPKATISTFAFGLMLALFSGLFFLLQGSLVGVVISIYVAVIGVRTFQTELAADLLGSLAGEEPEEEEEEGPPPPRPGREEEPQAEPPPQAEENEDFARELADFRGDLAEFLEKRRRQRRGTE